MAVFARGYVTYLQGDIPAALLDFNEVIRQKPDWSTSYEYRGYAYAFQGKYERALEDYRQFVKLEPYSIEGLDAMARAYRELGEYDKAKTNSDKALEIKPDYLRARENRAVVFLKQNKRDGALAELETILGLMPGDTWAKSYRNAIRKYQQDLLNALEDTMQGPMGPFAQPTLVSKIEPQYSEEADGPVSTQGSFADSSSTRMATYRMFTLCAGQGLDWMRRLLKLFMPGYSAGS